MQVCLFTAAVLLGPLDERPSKRFCQAVAQTYEAAEQAPGFVWRAPPTGFVADDAGTPLRIACAAAPSFYEDRDKVVQTLSAWRDLPSALSYVYGRGRHAPRRIEEARRLDGKTGPCAVRVVVEFRRHDADAHRRGSPSRAARPRRPDTRGIRLSDRFRPCGRAGRRTRVGRSLCSADRRDTHDPGLRRRAVAWGPWSG